MLFRFFRFLAVVMMAGIWHLVSRVLTPRIVFLVYGNERQRRVYWPVWADSFLPLVFPIGLIRHRTGWGFIAATKVPEERIDEEPEQIKLVLEAVCRVFSRVVAIALAGRLPSFARRIGFPLERPLLDGTRGTTFTVVRAIRAACREYALEPSRITVAVVGGSGHVGSFLVEQLAANGAYQRVIAIDPRANVQHSERIIWSTDPGAVCDAQVVVNLSRRGDDLSLYVDHLQTNAVVLDDTHPPMHRVVREAVLRRGAHLWKVVADDRTLRMMPRLPDFRASWVPGCLLEAIVVQVDGWAAIDGSQEVFDFAAQKSGIEIRLFQHMNDS